MRIAILITCHNRKDTTVKCLQCVSAQSTDDVFLVDDGSTDGTSAAVRCKFPQVKMIEGGGSLYWAKGMNLAWKTCLQQEWENVGRGGKLYDGFLWLNDDTVLNADAFEKLRAADDGESLIVGQLVDATGKEVYGLNVNGWVNGNFVYVPRKVYEKVGMICGDYAHAWADSDYAMRCKKTGVAIKSCGVVGSTEWHELRPSLRGRGFRWRWRSLWDPKGWNLHDLWLYRRRNCGVCVAIISCIHFVFHVLFGDK